MKTIDLTTDEKAMEYLRSLDQDTTIELPGTHEPSTLESTAVGVITGSHCWDFVARYNKWEWVVGELVATLQRDLTQQP